MTSPKARSLKRTVHRALLWRVALAAILISVVLSSIAYYTEQKRLGRGIVERAVVAVDYLGFLAQNILASPDPDRMALEALLEVRDPEHRRHATGRFVLVEVFDLGGNEIATRADDGFSGMDAATRVMSRHPHDVEASGIKVPVEEELDGYSFIHVSLPLDASDGTTLAHIEGVYAVSQAALADQRNAALKTTGYVFGVVMVSMALIYPIIGGLLSRMSGLTYLLLDSQLETLSISGSAIAKRDGDTDAHNYRVTLISVRLAEKVGLSVPQIQGLIKGAFLHDVGKIGIRDDILLKPGKLDDAEFEVMKTHVSHGLDIVGRSSWLEDAAQVVGFHHERFDGKGYMKGLRGEEIPITARIFAIADVFDALTSKRPYKDPFSYDETMALLEEGRGRHFDPALLDAFVAIAPDLHAELAGRDDGALRAELLSVTDRYFVRELAGML